ncbi:MAG: neutral zinc metallopeptidase [Bacteroidales bacterium]|nr:neutral zinc metallopeptidase [Bacteroidales bacterium]
MKWEGRQGSGNIEDRRGRSTGRMAIGGGIGTIVIVIIVLLLGGDPAQLLDTMQSGGTSTETGQLVTTPEEDAMAQFVSVVLKDTETVWGKLFEQSGSSYRQPKLVLFRDQVQSACGFASAASGPFYCPGDEKVYIDLSFCDQLKTKFGAYGDFAIAYVIAHEIGHHVQNQLGILEKVDAQRSNLNQTRANQLTVRLELQADFLSGMWAHYAQEMLNTLEAGDLDEAINAAASVGDDNLQMKYQGRVVPDAFTHGTSAQRKEWFRKGWETGNLESGDTFSAKL